MNSQQGGGKKLNLRRYTSEGHSNTKVNQCGKDRRPGHSLIDTVVLRVSK